MKELGGYFELEKFKGQEYYTDLLRFNYGRSAMRYLIRAKQIKRILIPYYICDSLINAIEKENVEILYYHIGPDFLPSCKFVLDKDTALLVINYFGFLTDIQIQNIASMYPSIILDNTHAFFKKPQCGVDTLYSCRKFFGVSDGGYLATNSKLDCEFPSDRSEQRLNFLIGRLEDTASAHYKEYRDAETMANEEEIKQMSKLTQRILCGIDYELIKRTRCQNYRVLHTLLGNENMLKNMSLPDGPYGYPFLVENAYELRIQLQELKIYVPILWANVRDLVEKSSLERYYTDNILLLPVDQRYNMNDMEYLANIIKRGMNR